MKGFWQNNGCHSWYSTVYSLSCLVLCSGKWRGLHPFPQGGLLVPHRATLRSLSLVHRWVTRDNWNAVKVLFEESNSMTGPDLEPATFWDIARHPNHNKYHACAMYESSENYIFRNQSENGIFLCNFWIFHVSYMIPTYSRMYPQSIRSDNDK